ncbi:MAG: acyl-CoA carboxylase epsilon subunit [Marmoricola sp.]
MSETPEEQRPVLRVLTPSATPEEVAAVVAVLSAMGAAAPTPARPPRRWASYRRNLTPSFPHGPGGWRASGLPR